MELDHPMILRMALYQQRNLVLFNLINMMDLLVCILHHISPISIPCGQTNDDRRDVDDGGNVGDVHDGDDTDAM
uniref:Uncharacterized protein n=1 Tax=Wuchereria bancrofti TaxID=6293 RepID=A0A1I8EEK9_WUCBA